MGKAPSQREREARRRQRLTSGPAPSPRPRRRRWSAGIIVGALVALVLSTVAVALVTAAGDDPGDATGPADTSDPTTPQTIAPPVVLTPLAPGETISGETPCPAEDGSSPRTTSFENPPPVCIDTTRRYQADVTTSEGDLTMLLDTSQAPNTVNNFVVLSRYHFFEGVPFHLIAPNQAIVTGDATGDPVGTGGPGYVFEDEIPEVGVIYPVGTVAMFNEGPDTNGSRFFIATGEQAAALPPTFTVFGLVTDGLETLRAIEAAGDPVTGSPIEEVTISRVAITELEAPSDGQGAGE